MTTAVEREQYAILRLEKMARSNPIEMDG